MMIFAMLLIAACGYALLSGGPAERLVAVVMIIGSLGSTLVAHQGSRLWQGSEGGIFAIDLAALLAFAVMMLLSKRFWPIWTTAFQLLTVFAHFGPLARRIHVAIPFAFDEEIWGYVILVQLLIVTYFRRARPMPTSGLR